VATTRDIKNNNESKATVQIENTPQKLVEEKSVKQPKVERSGRETKTVVEEVQTIVGIAHW